MDIINKWVHFDDTLELEVFLNICEEMGVTWPNGFPARMYLTDELKTYNRVKHEAVFRCGYYVRKSVIYEVNCGVSGFSSYLGDLSELNRFKLC